MIAKSKIHSTLDKNINRKTIILFETRPKTFNVPSK